MIIIGMKKRFITDLIHKQIIRISGANKTPSQLNRIIRAFVAFSITSAEKKTQQE